MEDFPYSPNFGAKCKPNYNTQSSKYENETEDVRLITPTRLRLWEDLSFTGRGPTEMAAVLALFNAVYEDLEELSMTIDGEAVTGKFVKGSFWYSRVAPVVYDYGFSFQEVVPYAP